MTKTKSSYSHILHLALAIRNRGYTNKVRLRGLMQNQGFQPAQVGFACVAATSSRLVQDMSIVKIDYFS
jgi:hypothetical protein